MRAAILGAGGVGLWIGGRLALAGLRPGIIARGKTLAALRASGLSVFDTEGADAPPLAHIPAAQLHAAAHPHELSNQIDVLFVSVKTWQLPACLPMIVDAMHASPAALVIPLLNGVSATSVIQDAARVARVQDGPARVLCGIAKCIAYVPQPGSVVFPLENGLQIGPAEHALDGASLSTLRTTCETLRRAGVSTELIEAPEAMARELWRKFLITGCLGPVSAATRAPLDVVLSVPETRTLARDAIEEASAVAAAVGVQLDPLKDAAERKLEHVAGYCEPGMTYSITRDVVQGKPSEIFEFCGTVQQLGALHGVPTPAHSQLLATLIPQERLARGEMAYALKGT